MVGLSNKLPTPPITGSDRIQPGLRDAKVKTSCPETVPCQTGKVSPNRPGISARGYRGRTPGAGASLWQSHLACEENRQGLPTRPIPDAHRRSIGAIFPAAPTLRSGLAAPGLKESRGEHTPAPAFARDAPMPVSAMHVAGAHP